MFININRKKKVEERYFFQMQCPARSWVQFMFSTKRRMRYIRGFRKGHRHVTCAARTSANWELLIVRNTFGISVS